MLSRKVTSVFFWHLEPTGNRLEYSLKLIDRRLAKMFDKEKVVIMSYYRESWWPVGNKITTELYFDCSKAEHRLNQLMANEKNDLAERDYYFKPRRMKSKWNPALLYPFTKIITSPFTADRQPVILAFENVKEKDNFLKGLNEATKSYVDVHEEMWHTINL